MKIIKLDKLIIKLEGADKDFIKNLKDLIDTFEENTDYDDFKEFLFHNYTISASDIDILMDIYSYFDIYYNSIKR